MMFRMRSAADMETALLELKAAGLDASRSTRAATPFVNVAAVNPEDQRRARDVLRAFGAVEVPVSLS